jgi:hypothetical protein
LVDVEITFLPPGNVHEYNWLEGSQTEEISINQPGRQGVNVAKCTELPLFFSGITARYVITDSSCIMQDADFQLPVCEAGPGLA